MVRSPLALAALATVAVPGLDAFDVRRPAQPGTDFDTAVVIDAPRHRWVVRAPQHAAAGAALEAEVVLLAAARRAGRRGTLPFAVPAPVGFAHLPEGGRATVHAEIAGEPLRLERLVPGPGLAAALGRAIAAMHELPTGLVENAGLPVYDAGEYRQRRQAEVDEAARTGKVPAALLRRWEERLEDVALWRFRPDRRARRPHQRAGPGRRRRRHAASCTGATRASPTPPTTWPGCSSRPRPTPTDSIIEAYQLRRTELIDPHLVDRALLAGELALARWLLYGVRSQDDEIIDDAVGDARGPRRPHACRTPRPRSLLA